MAEIRCSLFAVRKVIFRTRKEGDSFSELCRRRRHFGKTNKKRLRNYFVMNVEKWEKLLEKLEDKILRFKEDWVIESDTSAKFKLEHLIKEAEREEAEVKRTLAEAYDLRSPSGAGILQEEIRKLNFSNDIAPIHRLNCDRKEKMDRFWAHFEACAALPFQYYFITSCRTQMPDRFSERAVVELLFQVLEDELEGLHRRLRPEDERLDIQRLTPGRNLQCLQRAFQKGLSRYFGGKEPNQEGGLFARYFRGKSYKYAAIAFQMNEGQWGKDHPAFFRWIIDTLSREKAPGVRVLLFFVVKIEGLHQEKKMIPARRAIIDTFDRLAEEYEAAAHLSPLKPVPETDLVYWFDDIVEGNLAKAEEVINGFIRSLSAEDRRQYKEKRLFNMDDIDLLQEAVFEVVDG